MKPIRYVYWDAGRSESKRPKQTKDCTVRALSILLSEPYDNVYREIAMAGRVCGEGWDWTALNEFMKRCGEDVSASYRSIPYPTLSNLLPFLSSGRYLVGVSGHVTAIVDGEIWDTVPLNEMLWERVFKVWKIDLQKWKQLGIVDL